MKQMMNPFDVLREDIRNHPMNQELRKQGYEPLFVADERARIAIIGHAPGIKAQEAMLAWGDASGQRLMAWLGVSDTAFRDPTLFALIPMDFYYQGKGKTGDNPPRKEFADHWHPQLFERMPRLELMVLAGQYAQRYYLGKTMKQNLTETVRAYETYLPTYFPIVHPSPLNFRWLQKNPWFEAEVVPILQWRISQLLEKNEGGRVND